MKASHLADALGRKRISETLGVGVTAVSNAVVRDKFPATWFLAVRELATAEGLECPPELFGMKPSNQSPSSAPASPSTREVS